MADYDIRCVNCRHKSHENGPCSLCIPPNVCQEFVRADLIIPRMIGQLQQAQGAIGQQTLQVLTATFELLAEAFPEALERLKTKAEQRNAEMQEQAEAERLVAIQTAEEAYKEAKSRELMDELAAGYANPVNVDSKPKPEFIKLGNIHDEDESDIEPKGNA